MKKKVLVLNGQYAPGYKGGGPIQSCINMVENLYDQFDFYVLCADRDYKETTPYPGVKINQWNDVGHVKVYYMSPDQQGLQGFASFLNRTDYDLLYLNGFFSPIFTIRPLILRRLHWLKNRPVILTPRGDFTGGCESKKLKKYGYIYLVKIIGMYRGLLWHATSEIEQRDIRQKFPKATVFTVPNLPTKFVPRKPSIAKEPGTLKLVFVSRIFPKKNLEFALMVLSRITTGKIDFDIYGPMEDAGYWAECKEVIDRMPDNVRVQYCGEAQHKDIPQIFARYHAFFFPTLGENYGHVIVEAMMSNCLCILSQGVTPWDDYIQHLGLGAKLSEPDRFVEILHKLLQADQQEMDAMLKFNNGYVAQKTDCKNQIDQYRQMFEQAVRT